jgi:hypothetical protein
MGRRSRSSSNTSSPKPSEPPPPWDRHHQLHGWVSEEAHRLINEVGDALDMSRTAVVDKLVRALDVEEVTRLVRERDERDEAARRAWFNAKS